MVKGNRAVTTPNKHAEEIGIDLLVRILRQAGIDRETWLGEKCYAGGDFR